MTVNTTKGEEEMVDGVRMKYIKQVVEENPDLVKGAEDISGHSHLLMQGVLQEHVDSSISKTINLPHDATVDQVKELYEEAWELGCKGVTIYRNGSRAEQVLSTEKAEDASGDSENTWPPELFKLDLPDDAPARRFRVSVDNQTVYIMVTEGDEGEPLEVFTKFPYESDPVWNVLCRQLSLSLRYGIPLVDIVKQLDKSVIGIGDMSAKIARILKRYLPTDTVTDAIDQEIVSDAPVVEKKKVDNGTLCPECSQVLTHQGGCMDCSHCGWSKCS